MEQTLCSSSNINTRNGSNSSEVSNLSECLEGDNGGGRVWGRVMVMAVWWRG